MTFNARTSETLKVVCQKNPPIYEVALGVQGPMQQSILRNAALLAADLESYPLDWTSET